MDVKPIFEVYGKREHFKKKTYDFKRYKVWYGRASGGSGSTAILRVKPKRAMTHIFIAVGGKGKDIAPLYSIDNICNSETAGGASSVGIDPSFESNFCTANGASSNCTYTAGTGGEEPVVQTSGLEDIFEVIEVVRTTAGSNGTGATLYNSYVAPSTTEAKSSYDESSRGYGCGGYNSGNTSYPAMNGYVKVEVVE